MSILAYLFYGGTSLFGVVRDYLWDVEQASGHALLGAGQAFANNLSWTCQAGNSSRTTRESSTICGQLKPMGEFDKLP
jgi:hypothetical protein